MQSERFFKSKIKRAIQWNGQNLTFIRYKKNEYHELTSEIDFEINMIGVFHDGGGYGGMLNYELYERDGSRTTSSMKPMVLCLYEDGIDLQMDDYVKIGDNIYKVTGKTDFKNMKVAFDVSLEFVDIKVGDFNA